MHSSECNPQDFVSLNCPFFFVWNAIQRIFLLIIAICFSTSGERFIPYHFECKSKLHLRLSFLLFQFYILHAEMLVSRLRSISFPLRFFSTSSPKWNELFLNKYFLNDLCLSPEHEPPKNGFKFHFWLIFFVLS